MRFWNMKVILLVSWLLVWGTGNSFAMTMQEESKQDQKEKAQDSNSEEADKSKDDVDKSDDGKKKKADDVDPIAEKVKFIQAEQSKKLLELYSQFTADTSPKERKKRMDERTAVAQEMSGRMYKLFKDNPKHELAFKSLMQIHSMTGGKYYKLAMELLIEHHMDHKDMGELCVRMSYGMPSKVNESLLKRIIDNSETADVKGQATFALASMLHQAKTNSRMLHSNKRFLDSLPMDAVAYLHAAGEFKDAKIEKLLTQVVDKFADVETRRGKLGENAKRLLFEIRHLSIGKVAPDIEGEDIDGVEFKLSDYRGKVVLLDFWGDW